MIVKQLIEHHLEFLSLKEGYTGSSESTLVKMPNCWKLHAAAHMIKRVKNGLHYNESLSFCLFSDGNTAGLLQNVREMCEDI